MTSANRIEKIHCGTFDAEQYWREPDLAKLPGFADPENLRIVSVMDELLFVFCSPSEALITRKAMNPAHKQYLNDIGFRFWSNTLDMDGELKEQSKSMLQLLAEADSVEVAAMAAEAKAEARPELEPFAAIPFTKEASERYRFICRMPEMDIIRKVNMKTYSTEMKERLELPNVSFIVNHSSELRKVGERLLREGSFLIKDNYGVSGKGNLLIDSVSILERVIAYMAAQERKGMRSQFVVEPYLDKLYDFSCQFEITSNGEYRFLSLQRLTNDDFAYQESYTPEPEFMHFLDCEGYFELMRRTAKELYSDGYYGHVCVDSMQLGSGELVPIVEINARKSMSLIKSRIDRYLASQELLGNLRFYSLTSTNAQLQFEDLLAAMEEAGILYKPGMSEGVIPLTANMLMINRRPDKSYKGRIYVSMVGRLEEARKELHQRLNRLFAGLSLQVLN
ncbi:hypothetical protein SAMN04487895_11789 [Paenibacillus sophorae]|uniref:ATP-grasp domain-containing protein n=1 Tax=Paenibacillus sophorae TaxID=1333845 RepID=A0A1H8UFX2_9BACL|nr:hypothetical protein [Paenibacillus sophorae]QWU13143.1 hypothetical protein KP014_14005 [Paenibacillus sophorae]SEP02071.1 hypothetical protein SAMN04487895_11789 [Paenibacillus sophorae]